MQKNTKDQRSERCGRSKITTSTETVNTDHQFLTFDQELCLSENSIAVEKTFNMENFISFANLSPSIDKLGVDPLFPASQSGDITTPQLELPCLDDNSTDLFGLKQEQPSTANPVTSEAFDAALEKLLQEPLQEETASMPQICEVFLSEDELNQFEQSSTLQPGALGGRSQGTRTQLADSTTASLPDDSTSSAADYTRPRKVGRPRIHSEEHYRKAPKRRVPDKGTEEYTEKRARNNVAVRKSRDKAKQRQQETEQRVSSLTQENQELQRKVDQLQKELNVIRGLFSTVGAALPQEYTNYLAGEGGHTPSP